MKISNHKYKFGVLIVAVLAAAGAFMIFKSHAATLAVSSEAEQGTVTGAAALKDDATASGGKTVAFKAETGSPGSSSFFYESVCSKQVAVTTAGTLKNSVFSETSGIVASRLQDNAYWVHNDSGDTNRIFSIDGSGALLGIFTLTGATATDWEDISIGPGPVSGKSYIYVADTGNNDLDRSTVQIYRVAEPDPNNGGATKAVAGAEKLNFKYPDGPAHNVEAVFVDPSSGEIYLVDKSDTRIGYIYKAPAGLAAGSTTTLTKVGELGYGSGSKYEKITGADMAPDGGAIAIRTYENAYVYNRPSGSTVAASLTGTAKGCATPNIPEDKGEAIAFRHNSSGLVTVSEGASQPLHAISVGK